MAENDFIREVDEEFRREQLARLWDKYGTWVLAGAVAIVALVGGYKYMLYSRQQQAMQFGDKYLSALEMLDQGKKGKAMQTLSEIAANGPAGYRTLARLREASARAAEGKHKEAVGAFSRLASDSSADPVFRDFARLQAAMLQVDKASPAELEKMLGGMAKGKSAWRYSALEMLALSAYRAGELQKAEQKYNRLLNDRSAPRSIRGRAETMLALITDAMTSKDGGEAKNIPAKTAPASGKGAKSSPPRNQNGK